MLRSELWSCVGTCPATQFHGRCLSSTVTRNAETADVSFSEGRLEKSLSGDTCLSLDPTMMQCNMAHASLNCYMEAEDNAPQILKEGAAARGWRLRNPQHTQRGWRPVCAARLSTDRDAGNFRAWFWLTAWWGAREVLGLLEEQGSLRPPRISPL